MQYGIPYRHRTGLFHNFVLFERDMCVLKRYLSWIKLD